MQTRECIEHICNWLLDYNKNAKSSGFVVGVSGGIDSAVTSTLAAKTGLPTLCLEMPIHQESNQVNRAKEHIEWLKKQFNNVQSLKIDLGDLFNTFVDTVDQSDENSYKLSLANSRARLRMTTLYYYAQLYSYLVVGTGNKVEDFGIGFYTKYGDGGVDLSPIADLFKTEVFEIGKTLGVIESILTANPTDGLWEDNRTDEEQIGATYPELEWAMRFKGDVSILNDREKEVIQIYKTFHNANKHKMIPIPICVIPNELKL
ncbi:MAG: NAD(+) synthase [Flavobacteriales bacterium]